MLKFNFQIKIEFTERSKKRAQEKAIQDSIDMASIDEMDLDLDAMWENTVWNEIEDIADTFVVNL